MHMFFACFALAVVYSAYSVQVDDERAKKHLISDNYTVTWATAPAYEPNAELGIGDGNGHGGTLGWIRFVPAKDGVVVLSITYNAGRHPFKSKWPPDSASVTINRAWLKTDVYAALLRDLALVEVAKLTPVQRNGFTFSSNDFWVYARLTANKKALIERNWAGYEDRGSEVDYAKPRAAVNLTREAINGLDFKNHTLTDADRAWADAKFVRDWERLKDLPINWWVRGRYIETIGVVGGKATLPILRDILATDPLKGKELDRDHAYFVYCAINAITRLTKTDVRDTPVEEMDIEKTRRKVLDMLNEQK